MSNNKQYFGSSGKITHFFRWWKWVNLNGFLMKKSSAFSCFLVNFHASLKREHFNEM